MKTIQQHIVVFLLLILVSCGNDDNNIIFEDDIAGIKVEYETTRIENIFLNEGTIPAPVVNWSGEKGTFTSTSEAVIRGVVIVDENTGAISWKNTIPLGEVEIDIEASNSTQSTKVKISINTTFVEGVLSGGFNTDTSDEPDYSNVTIELYLHLFSNGTVSLTKPDDPTFSGTGTWQADGPTIVIRYTTTESSPNELVMKGFLGSGTFRSYKGKWGENLDSDGNITMPKGVFSFFIT